MRDPHSRAGPHDRLERGHEAARRVDEGHVAALRALVDVGLAVRHDHHALAVEVPAQRVLEPLGRPQASLAVRLPLRGEALHEVADVPQEGSELGRRPLAPDEPPQLVAPAPPGQSRRDQRDDGGRRGRGSPKASSEERPGRRLPSLDEAQVVDEDDEAESLIGLEQRNRGRVHLAPGKREDVRARSSRPPAGASKPGRTSVREARAGERGGVVEGLGLQREVGAARRRSHHALVAGQLDEDLAQLRLLARPPVRHERLARPADRELGAQQDVPLEPAPRGAADDHGGTPGQEGQARHQREREPQRLPHGKDHSSTGSTLMTKHVLP